MSLRHHRHHAVLQVHCRPAPEVIMIVPMRSSPFSRTKVADISSDSSIVAALPQEQGDAPPFTLTTVTIGLPASCTMRPTQTITATTGCPTPCATWANNCWDDRQCFPSLYESISEVLRRISTNPNIGAVELECGCPSMTVQPVTETVCPTVTSCMQCTVSRMSREYSPWVSRDLK